MFLFVRVFLRKNSGDFSSQAGDALCCRDPHNGPGHREVFVDRDVAKPHRAEVVPQHGAKDGETTDAMALTEASDFAVGNSILIPAILSLLSCIKQLLHPLAGRHPAFGVLPVSACLTSPQAGLLAHLVQMLDLSLYAHIVLREFR